MGRLTAVFTLAASMDSLVFDLTESYSHLLRAHYVLETILCFMNKAWDTVVVELRAQRKADISNNGMCL